MAFAAGIGVRNRHCLSGFNTLHPDIVLSRDVKEVRGDIVHPVVFAVFPHNTLAEPCTCLHGFCGMAVNAVYLYLMWHADLGCGMGLDIGFILMATNAEVAILNLSLSLMIHRVLAVWVMAVSA